MPVTRNHSRNKGCWTCKLRRKKCDEADPICGGCSNLGIECDHGPKPAWMDAGEQQRQKTALVKDQIKRNAVYKRERVNLFNKVSAGGVAAELTVIPGIAVFNDSTANQCSVFDKSRDLSAPLVQDLVCQGPSLVASLPWSHQQHRRLNTLVQSSSIETDFIMKYLDFVFPALFSYYQPSIFETGRSWLLLLLSRNRIAYHAALGLSCYYFTVSLTEIEVGTEYADCKQLRWEAVEQQAEQCYDSLRNDISVLHLTQPMESTLEKIELLESLMQVLTFEIAMGKSTPWNSHLPPAYTLFEEIMTTRGDQNQSHSGLNSRLLSIGDPIWTNKGLSGHIWSPEQAGFRFCAGFLIVIDVIASTALREAPALSKYHKEVLSQMDNGNSSLGSAEICLSKMFGCSNWAILSIAEVSTLNVWKQERIRAKTFSFAELSHRARSIAADLSNNISATQRCNTTSTTSTLIWAHAAQLYLTVTVQGWQLNNTEIRANVTRIIGLLQVIPPHRMRALAWPLCVAGCLALEAEECLFIGIYSKLDKIHTVGALEDTRQILEKVWQIRTTLDAGTWNLASCFAMLGFPILLL